MIQTVAYNDMSKTANASQSILILHKLHRSKSNKTSLNFVT